MAKDTPTTTTTLELARASPGQTTTTKPGGTTKRATVNLLSMN